MFSSINSIFEKLSCRTLVILLVFTGLVSFMGLGCDKQNNSQPAQTRGETVIQVNDVKITLSEFNQLLKFEVYVDPEMDLTEDSRQAFIDYLVQKELMIQEAIRMELDRTDEFTQAIERHWESTLIRNLVRYKSEALKKKVVVTQDEIREYYGKNKDQWQLPLEEVKEDIHKIIESGKLEAQVNQWTQALRAKADIKIDTQKIRKG